MTTLFEHAEELLKEDAYTLEDLADALSLSRGAALEVADCVGAKEYGKYFYIGRKPKWIAEDPLAQLDQANQRLRKKNRHLNKRIKTLTDELSSVVEAEELSQKTVTNEPVEAIQVDQILNSSESTAIALLSDWHVGEKVDPDILNGHNEYDPTIAEARSQLFFAKLYEKLKWRKEATNLAQLFIWLGGDFISGYIHPELEESNYLSPVEESQFVQRLLAEGIKTLSELGLPMTILTSQGNHGRSVTERRQNTYAENSFEWGIYQNLQQILTLSGVEANWKISKSYYNYVDIYGKVLRFHHGDNYKFSGGDNYSGSVLKNIRRINENQVRADYDFFGHVHTYFTHQKFMSNGSLIGPGGYSFNSGFPLDRPQQGIQIIDSLEGFIDSSPLSCEF